MRRTGRRRSSRIRLLAAWAALPFLAAAASSFEPFRQPAVRRPREVPFSDVRRVKGGYALRYGFKNFDGAALEVGASLDQEVVADSIREFGFSPEDLAAVDRWYERAQRSATSERALDDLAAEHRRRRAELYARAGFRYQKAGVIEADIPLMVRRNAARLIPLARSFAALAGRMRYGSEDLVGAVAAMVQTSLRYEMPDVREGRRVIGGVLPPPKALVLGQGDCDTKTALLAGVLKSWPNLRMVGLAIPEHYLMAVHRIPRRGEVYLEHEGLTYVMVESAGPAWLPPGAVGDLTEAHLRSGKEFRIQPL